MQEYEIEFYDKADGSEPAKEFILALDAKMRAKVVRTVGLLREEGPSLREPYSKHLEDGIFEIRTKFGSDITRVLYFFVMAEGSSLRTALSKRRRRHLLPRSHLQSSTVPIISAEGSAPNDQFQ